MWSLWISLFLLCITHRGVAGSDGAAEEEPVRTVYNRTLKVTTIIEEPFMFMKTADEFEGNARFSGYLADLLEELAEVLAFDYEISLVPDGKYGALNPEGNWDGLIGEVAYGRADIALAPLTAARNRRISVALTEPFMRNNLSVLVSTKYTNITSLHCLLDNPYNLTYGFIGGSLTEEYFRNANTQPMIKVWAEIAGGDTLVSNFSEGIKMVTTSPYAFICEKPLADFYAQKDCGLKSVDSFGNRNGFRLAVPKLKDDRYLDLTDINRALTALDKDGTLDSLKEIWWNQGDCGEEDVGGGVTCVQANVGLLVATYILAMWY